MGSIIILTLFGEEEIVGLHQVLLNSLTSTEQMMQFQGL